ncbi:MAG: hypothetical protein NTU58_01405 [Candidatus Nealsonbacteria bacterium]|nr:hypothetical protein [Candidatus Nealsonbacteria bacterium]
MVEVKILKEEDDFIELDIGFTGDSRITQWEAAKRALFKNKKVFYTFNDERIRITPQEARAYIYPDIVRGKTSDLEKKEGMLIKELLKIREKRVALGEKEEGRFEKLLETRKEIKEMKRIMKFLKKDLKE